MKQTTFTIFLCFLLSSSMLFAQNTESFKDENGATVELQIDQMIFAEKATSSHRVKHFQRDPANMVGSPDMGPGTPWPNRKVTSLGCFGSVTAEFISTGFVDGPGPDLLVFEVGQVFEKTDLSISTDGKYWIKLGAIEGGKAAVDIAHPKTEGKVFHFVRLRDKGTRCDYAKNDGADIDAIAAINYDLSNLIEPLVLVEPKTDDSLLMVIPNEEPNYITASEARVDFTIYPNPTNSELNLKFNLKEKSEVSAYLFNQSGKRLRSLITKETRTSGTQIISYSLGTLPSGTYYVQLIANGESVVKKLIKHTK